MSKGPKWTEREEKLLKESVENKHSLQSIVLIFKNAAIFDKDVHERSEGAIRTHISLSKDLNLTTDKITRGRWTVEDDKSLVMYASSNLTDDQIAERLHRTPDAIIARKYTLKLNNPKRVEHNPMGFIDKVKAIFGV